MPRHGGFLFENREGSARQPLQQTVRARQADDASSDNHDALIHFRYDTARRPVY
jgi:hypothetical protein